MHVSGEEPNRRSPEENNINSSLIFRYNYLTVNILIGLLPVISLHSKHQACPFTLYPPLDKFGSGHVLVQNTVFNL